MFKFITAFSLIFSVAAQAADANKAADFYSKRDFNEAGTNNAQSAIDIYNEVVTSEADADRKMQYQVRLAEAHYFLGSALGDESVRKANHQSGMDNAQAVIDGLGVQNAAELTQAELDQLKTSLNDTQKLNLAEAMYFRGTNLASWGKLNGIASSIGRLGEVFGLMSSVRGLGFGHIQNNGPDRTEGRIKFVLPGIFGGDLDASENFLKNAVRNTASPGQKYSVNGYNNVYLAETLHANNKEAKAGGLLKAFISADPSTMDPGSRPENKQALERANELASEWGI